MRIRKRKKGQAGEMIVAYESRLEMNTCRFRLLKSIIQHEPCITLIVDTNQRIGPQSLESAEQYLQQTGVLYVSIPVNANSYKFFGFGLAPRGRKTEEKILVMEMSGEQFTEQLCGAFGNYDIAIGIGRLLPFQDTCDHLRANEAGVLFNTSFFRDSLYDSVVCSSLRSTIDIEKQVEAALDEIAL
jgi:hypothetical protein